jgi:glutathione peroxidase
MRILLMFAWLFGTSVAASEYPPAPAQVNGPLDFVLCDNAGAAYPLAQHRGKVVVLVNVASKCGFTKQYAGLQALYAREQGKGLVIIAVPANDFLAQEPGSDEEIASFCSTTYGVSFPLMAKAVVAGKSITPLYRWLTEHSPFPGAIAWNFTKFLIGRDGQVVARFGSRVAPEAPEFQAAVAAALAAPAP